MFNYNRNFRIAIASLVSLLFACPTTLSKDASTQSKPTGKKQANAKSKPVKDQSVSTGQKRALIIGISTYDKFTKDHPANLHCEKDVEIVSELLKSNFGFNNIKTLKTPAETTKKAILAALEQLRSQTGSGDTVHIHYSGHGSRLRDPNNRKSDGYAETLLPSDTDLKDEEGTEIRDAEIAFNISRILEKQPKLVSMTIDCCHSGTLTRDTKKRGITRGYPSNTAIKEIKATTRGNSNEFVPANQPLVLSSRKNVVVLSACRPDQEAHEWPAGKEECGLFTHALRTALNDASAAKKKNYTYDDLLSDMSAIMVNERKEMDPQVPQLDGQRNYLLMDTVAIPTDNAYTVEHSKENKLWLDAGSIMGMTAGSKFDLFEYDVKDFKNTKPVASAEILDNGVKLAKAELKITSGGKTITDKADQFFLLRGVERSRNIEYPIAVSFKKDFDPSIQNDIWKQLEVFGFKLSDGSNWDVQFSAANSNITVATDIGRPIWSAELSNDPDSRKLQLDEMSFALHKEAMRHYLHEMQHDNGKLDVKINIIPVTGVEKEEGVLDPSTVKLLEPKNPSLLKDGDWIQIELVNNTDKPLYMSVFDARCDGNISPIFPLSNADQSLGDQLNLVAPRSKWVIPNISTQVSAPFGVDRFKVVATTSKHDLRPLFKATTRGHATRSVDEHPLVKLLTLVRDADATRGTEESIRGSKTTIQANMPEDDWVVAKMDLLTQEKKSK